MSLSRGSNDTGSVLTPMARLAKMKLIHRKSVMGVHGCYHLNPTFLSRRRRRLSAARLLRMEAPRRVFGDT